MNKQKEKDLERIDRCPECNCATGEDWTYQDFSNKSIMICGQCKAEIDLMELVTKTITINVEVGESPEIAVEEVLRLLREGYTSGIDPTWDIVKDE